MEKWNSLYYTINLKCLSAALQDFATRKMKWVAKSVLEDILPRDSIWPHTVHFDQSEKSRIMLIWSRKIRQIPTHSLYAPCKRYLRDDEKKLVRFEKKISM